MQDYLKRKGIFVCFVLHRVESYYKRRTETIKLDLDVQISDQMTEKGFNVEPVNAKKKKSVFICFTLIRRGVVVHHKYPIETNFKAAKV